MWKTVQLYFKQHGLRITGFLVCVFLFFVLFVVFAVCFFLGGWVSVCSDLEQERMDYTPVNCISSNQS